MHRKSSGCVKGGGHSINHPYGGFPKAEATKDETLPNSASMPDWVRNSSEWAPTASVGPTSAPQPPTWPKSDRPRDEYNKDGGLEAVHLGMGIPGFLQESQRPEPEPQPKLDWLQRANATIIAYAEAAKQDRKKQKAEGGPKLEPRMDWGARISVRDNTAIVR